MFVSQNRIRYIMLIKISLRDQIRDFLIKEIILGNLATGQRLSLVALSKELEVSVTPIREALTQLEQAGIVISKLNQGFFLKRLDIIEAKDIYQAIGFLEGLAIKESTYSKKDINALEKFQNAIQQGVNPLERQKKDHEFHQALIKNYSNETIKTIIENLKATVYIIELEYMKSDFVNQSDATHLKIINMIREGNLSVAYIEMEKHWYLSYKFLKNIINENE